MKKLGLLSGLFGLFFLSSCIVDEGDIGPPGPQGRQGPIGPEGAPGESGYVFEWTDVDFTGSGNYEVLLEYPTDFEVFDSDVALVYFYWPTEENPTEDVWRQLPQTIIHPEGLLQYNFDFTKFDVRLFLDSNFDLDLLGAQDTDDWDVRVVVMPGEFWNSGRVDFSDYEAVKRLLGLPELNNEQNDTNRKD